MNEKDIILCRCENITLGDLHEALDKGITSMEEIKRELRVTMGPCQGKTCKDLIIKEISRYTGKSIEEIDIPVTRAPVKPVKLGKIVGGEKDA